MPAEQIIIDTGPLVAYLADKDDYHVWATARLAGCALPFLTCEAVLSETFYKLRKNGDGLRGLAEMIESEAFQVVPVWNLVGVSRFAVANHIDFADSCLVALSEKFPRLKVVTIDRRDFCRIRRFGAEAVPYDAPPR